MTEYVIVKNEKQYVKLDALQQIKYTTDISLAERFTYEKANSFLKNNISKRIRSLHKTVVLQEDTYTNTYSDSSIDSIDDTIFKEHSFDWITQCSNFQIMLSQLEMYQKQLDIEYDLTEKERVDISHRFEFPKKNGSEFNAAELCKLGTRYREVLRKRRLIKNEKRNVGILKSANIEDFKSGSVLKQLQTVENQMYTPRILVDLFEM